MPKEAGEEVYNLSCETVPASDGAAVRQAEKLLGYNISVLLAQSEFLGNFPYAVLQLSREEREALIRSDLPLRERTTGNDVSVVCNDIDGE